MKDWDLSRYISLTLQNMYVVVCLFICLFVYLFVVFFVYLFICLFVCLFIYLKSILDRFRPNHWDTEGAIFQKR